MLRYSPVDTPGHRLVLIVLADHARADGTGAYPAVATIAGEARLSERTVQYALRSLEQDGHIERQGATRHGTTIYRVTMDRGDDYHAANWPAEEGGAKSAPPEEEGAQPLRPRGATVAPKPSREPSSTAEPSETSSLASDGSRAAGANGDAPAGHHTTWERMLEQLAGQGLEQLANNLGPAELDGNHWTIDVAPQFTTIAAERYSEHIRAALRTAGATNPTIEVRPRVAAGQPAGAPTT